MFAQWMAHPTSGGGGGNVPDSITTPSHHGGRRESSFETTQQRGLTGQLTRAAAVAVAAAAAAKKRVREWERAREQKKERRSKTIFSACYSAPSASSSPSSSTSSSSSISPRLRTLIPIPPNRPFFPSAQLSLACTPVCSINPSIPSFSRTGTVLPNFTCNYLKSPSPVVVLVLLLSTLPSRALYNSCHTDTSRTHLLVQLHGTNTSQRGLCLDVTRTKQWLTTPTTITARTAPPLPLATFGESRTDTVSSLKSLFSAEIFPK